MYFIKIKKFFMDSNTKYMKKHICHKSNNLKDLKTSIVNYEKKVNLIIKNVDPIKKLLETRDDILKRPVAEESEKAFLCRQLIQVTLPHSSPGHTPIWTRRNNNFMLSIKPGYDKGKFLGYPFGSIPRLIIFWITKEALSKKTRNIILGDSLASFMRQLGLNTGGGKRGDSTRLKNQMQRLLRSNISLEYDHDIPGKLRGTSWVDMHVAKKGRYWWDVKTGNKSLTWENKIELDQDFYDAIISYPVPLDIRALNALKSSPMALDLYAWVTWRTFVANKTGDPQTIKWRAFNRQLGSDYNEIGPLRKKCKLMLKRIAVIYPSLKVKDIEGGFQVLPSK